jgi:hypothetical protein
MYLSDNCRSSKIMSFMFRCLSFNFFFKLPAMNSKSTLETLNTLARYVFRSFYPENFIVVNELLHNTEFVQSLDIAKRLNLTEQTVNKSLNDLRQKRFVHRVHYKEIVFWGFDYHALVNIVRYKVSMLKLKESEKSGAAGSNGASGGYVCSKCGRVMAWSLFVKLATSGVSEPICQSRTCGGKLQKESKRAAEGLKPLEVISRALQRLEGQEIPTLGRRSMNAIIEEAARKEDEQRPDGDPVYEMPVLGPGKTDYIVQLSEVQTTAPGQNLVPPELLGLVPEKSGASRKPAPPPWLLPAPEAIGDEEKDVAAPSPSVVVAVVELPTRAVPLADAMHDYPAQLVEQLGVVRSPVATEIVWDRSVRPVPFVVVKGTRVPMNELTNEHILAMSAEEYQQYFEVYQEECNERLKSLFMS